MNQEERHRIAVEELSKVFTQIAKDKERYFQGETMNLLSTAADAGEPLIIEAILQSDACPPLTLLEGTLGTVARRITPDSDDMVDVFNALVLKGVKYNFNPENETHQRAAIEKARANRRVDAFLKTYEAARHSLA